MSERGAAVIRSHHLVVPVVALLGILLAAPGGTAQVPVDPPVSVALGVVPHGAPIPMGESANATVNVGVTCPSPSVYSEPVQLSFSANASADWMDVQVEPASATVTFGPQECVSASTTKQVVVSVLLGPQLGAPAFRPAEITFRTGTTGAVSQVTWGETVRMEGDFRFEIAEDYQEGDGSGTIHGTLRNNANGPILVRFTLADGPDKGELGVPDGVVVPARATDGNDSAPFSFRLEQDGRGAARMTVRVEATAQENTTHVVPPGYDLRLLVEPRAGRVQWTTDADEELEAPGPGVVVAVLLVAAVAAALGRRT